MSRLRQLISDSAVYGVGGIFARSISLLLLPIYTRIFNPEQYGSIEMLVLIAGFCGAIMMMGLDSAQSMYFFKYKNDGKVKQTEIISSILQWRIIWGSGVVLCATFIAPILYAEFFNNALKIEHFAIAFVSTFFAQVLSQSIEVFRLLYRPWSFVVISLSETILAGVLIVTCVTILDQGIFGFFLGSAISGVIISTVSWFIVREYLDISRLHHTWWPMMLRFGAPLVPAEAAFFLMTSLDRWFVNFYEGAAALGLFAVGAKFSLIIAAAVGVFRKAWWPIAMDAMHSDDGPETFRLISRLYLGLGSAFVVFLVMLAPWLLQVLTAPAYHDTWPIAAILAWPALFYGFALFGSAGIWKLEKMGLNLYLMVGATIIGALLNWILVPVYGGLGAAVATVLTYLFWNITTMLVSNYFWPIKMPVIVLASQVLLGLAYTALYILNKNAIYVSSQTLFALGLLVICIQTYLSLPPTLKNRFYSRWKSE